MSPPNPVSLAACWNCLFRKLFRWCGHPVNGLAKTHEDFRLEGVRGGTAEAVPLQNCDLFSRSQGEDGVVDEARRADPGGYGEEGSWGGGFDRLQCGPID